MKHKILSIDIETYSPIPIDYGVYRYTDSDDFEILLIGYAWDDEEPTVIDLTAGEKVPDEFIEALTDPDIEKHAFNASFERVCLSKWLYGKFGEFIYPRLGWWCTQKHAAMMGLPSSLKDVGAVLGLAEQKDRRGKALIDYFCKPCSPTAKNNGRTRNLPAHDMEKWKIFKEYNRQDVISERAISKWLDSHYPQEGLEDSKVDYQINEQVNDNGILIDMQLVNSILDYYQQYADKLSARARQLTGLENPNSVAQLKDWLAKRGIKTNGITKDTQPQLIKTAHDLNDPIAEEVLTIRANLSKTSTKKYTTMQNCVCSDGRIHGVMNYYGANRTGRFASRLIQVQNLPRNSIYELNALREIVKSRGWDTLECLGYDIPELIKQLIRTAIIAPEGKVLSVADFSAIEARVIAWAAGETETQKIFAPGGSQKIYEGTAAAMFGVPIETIAKGKENYALRQRGKVATLACIAENSLIPTDKGYKFIQDVTANDLVWDGESWVSCEGVIYKGKREVFDYDGLSATNDHTVYTKEHKQIRFGQAAESGSHLLKQRPDWAALRRMGNNISDKEIYESMERLLRSSKMPLMRTRTVDTNRQFTQRIVNEMPRLSSSSTDSERSKMDVKTSRSAKDAVRKSNRSAIPNIRSKRDKILFRVSKRSSRIRVPSSWRRSEFRNRPNRQQRQLRTRELALGYANRKSGESKNNNNIQIRAKILALRGNVHKTLASKWAYTRTNNFSCKGCSSKQAQRLAVNRRTVNVYDIRNAGRYHRYAVSTEGIIVHNCGYGGGVAAMRRMDTGHKLDSLSDNEVRDMVNKWRRSHPHIVQWWSDLETACRHVIEYHDEIQVGKFKFRHDGHNLFIRMPSGRWITYFNCRIDPNGTEIVYGGTDTNGWSDDLRTYSGKLAENVTQAVARDCLCGAIRHLYENGYKIIFHVHDEIICEVPDQTDEYGENPYMRKQEMLMTKNIGTWDKGIYHPAPGFTSKYYMKD